MLDRTRGFVSRGIIAGLALIGLAGIIPVSLAELIDGDACPQLGVLPACHLLTVAYALILLTVVRQGLWRSWLFLVGWILIFSLAAIGSGLELLGHGRCPQSDGGIPKCYVSLGLALALGAAFLMRVRAPDAR